MTDAVFIADPGVKLVDLDLAKRIADKLDEHYPGHIWAVNANHETGIASVHNLRISGKYGFRLFISDLDHDPGLKEVVRAGGELLERHNAERGRYNPDTFTPVKKIGHV